MRASLRKVFKAFQYRDFRLMWFGACTSSIGTWMQIVAQGWLIYRLSHSAFLLALDQFLAGIPIFLLSLIGGVVADRTERRKILLVSQFIQMASAAILTLLVATGIVSVWEILCLSFISGIAQSFGGPAYQALIPTLVDRDDMPNAIALNSIQFNLAVTVGPALAGLTLARLGEKWCFGLNAVSFLAPVISLLMITARFLPQSTKESVFGSLKQGIRFLRQQGSMEALIVLAFFMTALSMPMRTYIPVFVKDIFRRGPETYGNLLVADGSGIHLRFARCRWKRQYPEQRALRVDDADLPGNRNFRLLSFAILALFLCHVSGGRSIDDGRLRHRHFTRAVDYYQ